MHIAIIAWVYLISTKPPNIMINFTISHELCYSEPESDVYLYCGLHLTWNTGAKRKGLFKRACVE